MIEALSVATIIIMPTLVCVWLAYYPQHQGYSDVSIKTKQGAEAGRRSS